MSPILPSPSITPIDRLAPTVRPPRAVMRQNWLQLLFLHWVVAPERLRPLVPAGLDLDLFEGRAYVGLVPFTMTGVRPVWAPAVPGLSSFHETNVRTYVHRAGRDPGRLVLQPRRRQSRCRWPSHGLSSTCRITTRGCA